MSERGGWRGRGQAGRRVGGTMSVYRIQISCSRGRDHAGRLGGLRGAREPQGRGPASAADGVSNDWAGECGETRPPSRSAVGECGEND